MNTSAPLSPNNLPFALQKTILPALAAASLVFMLAPRANAEQITIGPFTQQVSRTSALVVWETDTAAPSKVAYGAYPNTDQSAEDTTSTTHHVVKIDGLSAASQYAYQVNTSGGSSPSAYFWTEKDKTSAYRIGVYGDTRSRFDAHKEVVDAMAKEKPLIYLNTGDLVASGSKESDWLSFFKAEKAMLQIAPFYPTLGNHEGSGDRYLELFELPDNSPQPERYYSLRYASSSFASIDMYLEYKKGSEQYNWLEKTLKDADDDPDILHSFALIHSGPYDSGSHGSNTKARAELVPLFEQYHVEIVFSGHDHDYERGTVNGVKYVVTGGGGAPIYGTPKGGSWTEVKAAATHYCLLDIDRAKLTLTAKKPDGTQIDMFTMGANDTDAGAADSGQGDAASAQDSSTPQQDSSTPQQDAATPNQDSGATADSGSTNNAAADGADESDSCSCSTPGGGGRSHGFAAAMLLALAAGLSRSRRSRRRG